MKLLEFVIYRADGRPWETVTHETDALDIAHSLARRFDERVIVRPRFRQAEVGANGSVWYEEVPDTTTPDENRGSE